MLRFRSVFARWIWLATVLVTVVACVTASEVPKAAHLHALQPKASESKLGENPALSVVHSGPKGDSTSDAMITIVFNHAMRSLSTAEAAPQLPVTLSPPIEGQWIWVGTNAVQFQPKAGKLPLGTTVGVSVAAEAKALDGKALGAVHAFSFTTPLPRVTDHTPSLDAQGLGLDTRVLLEFDQAVDLTEVSTNTRLQVGGRALRFKLQRPKEDPERRVLLIPEQRLPRASRIDVSVLPGLHAVGGNTPSPHTTQFAFNTFGPLAARLQCGWSECHPESPITLTFNNRVRPRDVKQRLTISPAISLKLATWVDENELTQSLDFDTRSAPRTGYQVTLAPDLTDEFGQTLTAGGQLSFQTSDFEPALDIGVSGEILQPSALRSIAIRSRNVARYDLGLGPLSPALAISFQDRPWEFSAVPAAGFTETRITPGITNHFYDRFVDVSPSLPEQAGIRRGALLLQASYRSGSEPVTARRMLQLTDLGLTVKLSKIGSVAWVTRLSTGEPIPNANVQLWIDSNLVRSFTSDQNGLVSIPSEAFVPDFYSEDRSVGLVASYNGDSVVQSVRNFLGPWRMPIPPQLEDEKTTAAFLFTERGVYRPGDEVWVKGIVRQHADLAANHSAGGMSVVAGKSLQLTLQDPNGTEVLKRTVTTSAFGSFAEKVRVPATAQLGSWQLQVAVPAGHEPQIESTSFAVAEYEPAEFSVTGSSAASSYLNGDAAQFEANATYLFGAPLANAEAHYTLSYEATSFTPAGADDFDTSDDAYLSDFDARSPAAGLLAESDAKLDASGMLRVTAPLAIQAQSEPKRVRFEASVSDLAHNTITGSAQAIVHPAAFYLGVERPKDWFIEAPGALQPRLAVFTPDGKRVSGQSVELSLIRRRWTSVREQWEAGYRQVYQRVDEPVATCRLTSNATTQSCTLPLTEGGLYLVRGKAKDKKGRVAYASQSIYAIGQGRVSWRDDAENSTVELVPNKKVYAVGDTARILVKSPFERAEALVTIERSGVIEKRRVKLTGPTPVVEVPISDAMRPNAYVAVHLLKQRSPNATSAQTPDELYRLGYAELRIDNSQRKLNVRVTPQAKSVRPRDTIGVDIDVQTKDGKGVAGEVTVYAVDEGVLMLTGYQLPDPVAFFTAPRSLQVATLESRAQLARIQEAGKILASEKGAEGGGGGDVRSDFRQSAYFNPGVLTDARGHAHVEFKAPDNLTTFRLMAVAVSKDDRYGNGMSQVVVNKPLMARPSLPRFLRAGDRFDASVVISTKDSKSGTVDVQVEASGAIVVEGERTQRVQVTPTGVVEVHFPAMAPIVGSGTLRFSARGATERDAVELTRRVVSPAQLETVAAYGETQAVDGQQLGNLETLRADIGGLDVKLASTRLVGLDGSMEQLVDYPYACTEQLASRLLPLGPLKDLAAAFGFSAPNNTQTAAETTVREILKRQRQDGGFGFWPESIQSHAFLSAYTLWVLKLAEAQGTAVPNWVYTRGVTYLRSVVTASIEDEDTAKSLGLSRDAQAFASLVLAQLGARDLGAIERLLEARASLGLPGHAWLLMASIAAELPNALRAPLVQRLESSISLVGNRATVENADGWYLDSLLASPLKTQALVLSALLAHDKQHPLAGKLVSELLARREGGSWRTTQESAFALLALHSYWKAQESDTPRFDARVWVGDTPVLQQTFQGRSTEAVVQHVAMTTLKQAKSLDVLFERRSLDLVPAMGTLFYEARLNYAPLKPPTHALDRGFAIHKTMRAVQPAELEDALRSLGGDAEAFRAGDLALVDLIVVAAAPRRFVVVDDPLPAGFVGFDSSLATNSQRLGNLEAQASAQTGFSEAWYRREMRDDRVLFFVDEMPAGMYHYRYLARATIPGSYAVPATRSLEMYQPEVFGRSAARLVTVGAAK